MDEELREAIVSADSLLSLVAYRFNKHIPADVVHDMRVTANRLRDFYDSRSNGASPREG
jgi:hypothetical protein